VSAGFTQAIEAALAPRAADPLAVAVLEGRAGPCYLIGRNADAERLAGPIRAAGLVDDGAPAGSTWNDLPVVGSADLPDGAVLVNAATSIRPVDVVRRFSQRSGLRLAGLADLMAAGGEAVGTPDFVADQLSRQTLVDVLRFRLTADPAYMAAYEVRVQDQYFEPFLHLRGEAFVDAGGFDGDTTEAFCDHDPDYREVHLFEPSPANMGKARARLAGRRDIHFHPIGVSDTAGELAFDPDAGSASAVGQGGGLTIRVTTLDAHLAGPVTLIKMDLEGWETRALAGSLRIIRDFRPKLALAVYHRASDFRDIARFALGVHPDYRVYLRHYTQGWSETVMFFV